MNNPFKSDKDIFGGIRRPQPKPTTTQKPAQNPSEKVPSSSDLNFRSQFKYSNKNIEQRSNARQQGYQSNTYSQKNINNYPQKVYGKQQYQSSKPIQQNYQPYRQQNQLRGSVQSNRQQNRGPIAQGGQNAREKITFGKPMTSQDANPNAKFDFQFDRRKYQNDLSSQGSSFQNQLYSQSDFSQKTNSEYHTKYQPKPQIQNKSKQYNPTANSGYKNTNFGYTSQSQEGMMSEEARNKFEKSLNMSPIVEHSQHKYDQGDMSDFMNLDNLGADIDKLLANSKNHEELRRLIGMEQFNNLSSPKQHQMDRNTKYDYRNEIQRDSMAAIDSKRKQFPEKYQPNNQYKQKYQQSIKYNYPSSSNNPQYPISSQFHPNQEHNKSIQRDMSSYSNPDNQQQGPGQVFNYADSSAKSNLQSQKTTQNNPSLANDLQMMIDRQMKKVYWNGKHRIFLSASDRIETVKYDLEYI